jgi:preprotein translocase subunit SecY
LLNSLQSAWKVGDLRRKILFTLVMFLIFRIGAHVPVPNINHDILSEVLSGQLFGFFDVISGGAFKRFTVFAMSITPYINASIIMQLLQVVVPKLEQLAKEGIEGRKKITQYIRYGTVILGFIQAIGMAIALGRQGAVVNPGFLNYMIIAITLTAGTAFLMWLGELITEKGIGNGISLIIFAGIVSRMPSAIGSVFAYLQAGTANLVNALLLVVIALLVIAAVVAVLEGQRRIPVQYAKRVVGRKVYGGQSTHIPLKVNQAGVIPIIFAMSILLVPQTIAQWISNPTIQKLATYFDLGSTLHTLIYAGLIMFFTYFYTAVTFNPSDVADNMKKYGGFIPGLRPGRPTAEYIDRVLSRITLGGAVFLALIAILPTFVIILTGFDAVWLGGTSLLIVVGVALDTMKQVESHLIMRHYQGFIK